MADRYDVCLSPPVSKTASQIVSIVCRNKLPMLELPLPMLVLLYPCEQISDLTTDQILDLIIDQISKQL